MAKDTNRYGRTIKHLGKGRFQRRYREGEKPSLSEKAFDKIFKQFKGN